MKNLETLKEKRSRLDEEIRDLEAQEKENRFVEGLRREARLVIGNSSMGNYGSSEVLSVVCYELAAQKISETFTKRLAIVGRGNISNLSETYDLNFKDLSREQIVYLCKVWHITQTKLLTDVIEKAIKKLDETCAENQRVAKQLSERCNAIKKSVVSEKEFQVTVNS